MEVVDGMVDELGRESHVNVTHSNVTVTESHLRLIT